MVGLLRRNEAYRPNEGWLTRGMPHQPAVIAQADTVLFPASLHYSSSQQAAKCSLPLP